MAVSYTHLDVYKRQAMVYLHEGKAAGIAGDLHRMLDEDFHYRLAMRLYSGSQASACIIPCTVNEVVILYTAMCRLLFHALSSSFPCPTNSFAWYPFLHKSQKSFA